MINNEEQNSTLKRLLEIFCTCFSSTFNISFVNNNPNYLYASWVLVLTLVNPVVGFSNMSMDSIIATEKMTIR